MPDSDELELERKAPDLRLIKSLLVYAKPYLKLILVAFILISLNTALELVAPYLIKMGIDKYINPYKTIDKVSYYEVKPEVLEFLSATNFTLYQKTINSISTFDGKKYVPIEVINSLNKKELYLLRNKDLSNLNILSLAFVVVIFLNFTMSYAHIFILNLSSQKIIYDLRVKIFTHLQNLPFSFFDRNPVGRLVTRVTNDTDAIQEMFSEVIIALLKDFLLVFGIIATMLYLNLKLAIISLSLLPIVILLTITFRYKAREIYRTVRTRLARINAYIAENISGMKISQLFLREEENLKRFKIINNDYFRATLNNLRLNSIYRPLINAVSSFTLAFIIYFGGGEIIKNNLEFGILFVFISYIQTLFRPIQDMAEKYDLLQSAMASSERVFALLSEPIPISDINNPITLKESIGSIEFKDVWFSYDKEEWVLKGVSFKVNPGESIGIVGMTGAGKTSIINLLCRFYEPQKGEILLDNINIKDISIKDLRRNIAVILQDVFLFATDIKGNIRLNNKEITDEEVKEAASRVQADKFIQNLPNGYNEKVEEGGSTLSAGQRQLISFARALVFNPRVLILDEATSNIDSATEQLITEALKVLIKGRTSVIIAHRLSTLENVNRIIVLNKGKIVETGTHSELLAAKGLYYHFYTVQRIKI